MAAGMAPLFGGDTGQGRLAARLVLARIWNRNLRTLRRIVETITLD